MTAIPFQFPQMRVLLFHGDDALSQPVRTTLLQAPNAFYLAAETSDSGALADLLAKNSVDAALLALDLTTPTAWRTMQQVQPSSNTVGVVVVGREVTVDCVVKAMVCGIRGYLDADAPAEEFWLAVQTVNRDGMWYNNTVAARIRERFVEPCAQLSGEEWQVVKLVASGAENKTIAEILNITVKSVERKVGKLAEKLQLRNRTALANWYFISSQAGPEVTQSNYEL
jgi:DNA-binding NarL/FixJ family response regulator